MTGSFAYVRIDNRFDARDDHLELVPMKEAYASVHRFCGSGSQYTDCLEEASDVVG